MRFMRMIVMMMAVLVFSGVAQAARFQIPAGHVTYRMTGQQEGRQELYWQNSGDRIARYSDMTVNMMGIRQPISSVNILDGKWAYNYDGRTGKATKIDNDKLMAKLEETGFAGGAPQEFSEEMMLKFGGEKTGTEEVLGRKCDIYALKKFGGSRVWVWKGVPLKSEWDFMGLRFQQEATAVEENARIDAAKFELPAGATVVEQDVDAMFADPQMKRSMEYMNDPKKQAEMEDAMKQLQEMQNNPEYRQAMEQMQALQNDPQFHENMRQMQEMPQMPKNPGVQTPAAVQPSEDFATETGQMMTEEAGKATQDTLKKTTRDGVKKGLGGMLKSVF